MRHWPWNILNSVIGHIPCVTTALALGIASVSKDCSDLLEITSFKLVVVQGLGRTRSPQALNNYYVIALQVKPLLELDMSAKEQYRTAPIDLPDLPPEIWLSIFRLATWSTDMFNPQLMVLMGCDTLYREQLREFKRSLVSSTFSFFWLLRHPFSIRLRRDILFVFVKHGIPSPLPFCSNTYSWEREEYLPRYSTACYAPNTLWNCRDQNHLMLWDGE